MNSLFIWNDDKKLTSSATELQWWIKLPNHPTALWYKYYKIFCEIQFQKLLGNIYVYDFRGLEI